MIVSNFALPWGVVVLSHCAVYIFALYPYHVTMLCHPTSSLVTLSANERMISYE